MASQVDVDRAIERYGKADDATRAMIDGLIAHTKKLDDQQVKLQVAGLVLGFLLVTGLMAVAVWVIVDQNPWAGTALAALDVGGVLGVYIKQSVK